MDLTRLRWVLLRSTHPTHNALRTGEKMSKSSIVGFCFAIGYLFVCFVISGFQFEGSWGGFFCFLLALPFSILSMAILKYIGGSFILFLILNAIWWYFLVKLIYSIWKWMR